MLDSFIRYASKVVSEVRISQYLEIAEVFELYGTEGPNIAVGLMMDAVENEPSHLVIDRAETLITEGLLEILTAIGVKVKDDVTKLTMVAILNAFDFIENSDESDYILEVTSSEETGDVEKLDILVNYATGGTIFNFSDYIDSIEDDVVSRIREVHIPRVEYGEDDSIEPIDPSRLALIKKFVAKYRRSRVEELVTGGVRPGLPMKKLLADNRSFLGAFEPKGADRAAIEYVGLLIMSDIPIGDLPTKSTVGLDTCFSSIPFISEVSAQTHFVIAELGIHE